MATTRHPGKHYWLRYFRLRLSELTILDKQDAANGKTYSSTQEGIKHQARNIVRWYAAAQLALLLLASAAGAQTLTGAVARVSDGDTIKVGPVRVRLHGIDAPETDQDCTLGGKPYRCGIDATNALKALAEGKPVTCAVLTTDRYGRLVARCRVGGLDLSREMVARGWALAYRRYLRSDAADSGLIQDESLARAARVGIWRGSFQAPWEWRKGGAK